jgi:hypothetical protein
LRAKIDRVVGRFRAVDERIRHELDHLVARVPINVTYDAVTFTCGHKWQALAGLLNTLCGKAKCWICSDEWLAKAVAEEQQNGEKPR